MKRFKFFLILILLITGCKGKEKIDFKSLRMQMVKEQLIARNISDKRVLRAMSSVPREEFVPLDYRLYAYIDGPLPIGEGQTISQPYIVALMTQLLRLTGKEKVLEIGTGSGYHAAILSMCAKEVYTIEIIESLAITAAERLRRLKYNNIKVKCGDGYKGWEEYAPYDAIILTCAPEEIPKPLIEQLKDGGRMVLPLGPAYKEQTLMVVEKRGKKIYKKEIIPVRFVPMVREEEIKKKIKK